MRIVVFSVVLLTTLVGAMAADYGAGFIAYVRGDYATALAEWQPLADEGHASAQRNLGVLYFEGRGVEQDLAAAARWYEKAAIQGHTSAQYSLGTMYADGRGVPRDHDLAIRWLGRAADQGHPVAASRVAGLRAASAAPQIAPAATAPAAAVAGYPKPKPTPPSRLSQVTAAAPVPVKSDDLPTPAGLAPPTLASVGPASAQAANLDQAWLAYTAGDIATALALWQEAAALGSAEAHSNIAALYAGGDGVDQDLAVAAQWLLPLADNGDSTAQFQLATLSQLDDRQQDFTLWMRRAADRGDAWAQAGIGVQHYEGHGEARDLSLAFQWYRRAAANYVLGGQSYILDFATPTPDLSASRRPSRLSRWLKGWLNPDAAALSRAMAAYEDADYATALTKLGALADQDVPQALTTLAVMLEQGLGLSADPEGAVALYRHAADLGDANAQHRLGLFYAQADTLNRDLTTAAAWFVAAANQGHPQAAYNLAVLSLGPAINDPQAAAAQFTKAAEAGIPMAQYDLALMHAKGEGLPKDLGLAREWMAAAAANGVPEAQFAVGLAFVSSRADYAIAHKWLATATANALGALRVRHPAASR